MTCLGLHPAPDKYMALFSRESRSSQLSHYLATHVILGHSSFKLKYWRDCFSNPRFLPQCNKESLLALYSTYLIVGRSTCRSLHWLQGSWCQCRGQDGGTCSKHDRYCCGLLTWASPSSLDARWLSTCNVRSSQMHYFLLHLQFAQKVIS